jgi:hypothetical protein
MYLYRQTAKGHDMVQLIADREEAEAKARLFVGEHSNTDGASSTRHEQRGGDVFRTYRTTSFGQRRATVRSIGDALIGLD